MARRGAPDAYLRAGTIEGIARPLVSERYLRLVAAEPWIRRLVPVMIVLFLVTVAIGAFVQVVAGRNERLADVADDLEMVTLFGARDLSERLAASPAGPDTARELAQRLPQSATMSGWRLLITDVDGKIVSSTMGATGQALTEVLGGEQPLTTLADRAGAMRLTLPDGRESLAMVRAIPGAGGQLAALQPVGEILEGWRQRSTALVILVSATGIVIVTLGIAFYQQAARAREADFICKEVRARIDTVLDRGHAGLWDWDIARGRIYWSDSLYTMLGIKREREFLSFGEFNAIFQGDDGDLFSLANGLAASADETIDREFRVRHANGEWIWLRARGQVVRDREGEGPHLVGIAMDITEQKRMAERTATADMRLRDAIETISEAFVLWDSTNHLVVCNTKFQDLHNLSPQAVQLGTSYESVHEHGSQPVVQTQIMLEEAPETGARSFEVQLGDGRWLQINERRTKDGGYVSVGTDITIRKREQSKLIESERRLIATVKDLRSSRRALEVQTNQLAHLADQYLEQKAEAEAANLAKATFLANMSHELRTPLNHIIGFADMMADGILGPLGSRKYEEYCRDIGGSGRYLLEVIGDILDMSRIEAGKRRIERQPFDISLLMEDAIAAVRDAAAAKEINLSVEEFRSTTVTGDRAAIVQVIGNLLRNAVNFTPNGGEVSLRAKRVGDAVNIFVQDTGIGIPKDALDKISRPFEQSGAKLNDGYRGSGLGLAIARSLVELHGGSLRIRSAVGHGTIVLVHLPLDGSPLVAALAASQMSEPKSTMLH